MKPKMALKPLVFALAAVMAVAAQAGGRDDHGGGRGHHNDHDNTQSLLLSLLVSLVMNLLARQSRLALSA